MNAMTWRTADVTLAGLASVACGTGALIGLTGWVSGQPPIAIAGGVTLAAGLVALIAGGWLHPLVLVVVSLPLPALVQTTGARASAALFATAIAIAGWGVRRAVDARPVRIAPFVPALIVIAALCTSALFAAHRVAAVREIANWLVLVGFFVAATDIITRTPAAFDAAVRSLSAVLAVCAGLAILQAIGVIPAETLLSDTAYHRAALAFAGPTELAMFFALGLPLTVHAAASARDGVARALGWTAVTLIVIGLLVTFSRASWLALVGGGLVLAAAGQRRFALWTIAAFVCTALLVDVLLGGVIIGRIIALPTDWVVEQRAALMLVGVLMFRGSPIVGIGPGGFTEELDFFGPQVSWLWDYTAAPHNGYVQMAAEAGIFGLLALLAFLVHALWVLGRAVRADEPAGSRMVISRQRALLWTFATACLLCFVEWPFAHGIGQIIMLTAAAGIAGRAPQKAPG